jgi:hypothetical protein
MSKHRIDTVPKGRHSISGDFNPRDEEKQVVGREFQRNGIICRPFGTMDMLPVSRIATAVSVATAGINPCVEVCRPFGTYLPPLRYH